METFYDSSIAKMISALERASSRLPQEGDYRMLDASLIGPNRPRGTVRVPGPIGRDPEPIPPIILPEELKPPQQEQPKESGEKKP